jgi:hypothetical protein
MFIRKLGDNYLLSCNKDELLALWNAIRGITITNLVQEKLFNKLNEFIKENLNKEMK